MANEQVFLYSGYQISSYTVSLFASTVNKIEGPYRFHSSSRMLKVLSSGESFALSASSSDSLTLVLPGSCLDSNCPVEMPACQPWRAVFVEYKGGATGKGGQNGEAYLENKI